MASEPITDRPKSSTKDGVTVVEFSPAERAQDATNELVQQHGPCAIMQAMGCGTIATTPYGSSAGRSGCGCRGDRV